MKFAVRNTWVCQRGKGPEAMEGFKIVAENYNDQVNVKLAGLTTILEPIMIVFLAVIVGSIVIAMFLPLIVLMDKLGEN